MLNKLTGSSYCSKTYNSMRWKQVLCWKTDVSAGSPARRGPDPEGARLSWDSYHHSYQTRTSSGIRWRQSGPPPVTDSPLWAGILFPQVFWGTSSELAHVSWWIGPPSLTDQLKPPTANEEWQLGGICLLCFSFLHKRLMRFPSLLKRGSGWFTFPWDPHTWCSVLMRLSLSPLISDSIQAALKAQSGPYIHLRC